LTNLFENHKKDITKHGLLLTVYLSKTPDTLHVFKFKKILMKQLKIQ